MKRYSYPDEKGKFGVYGGKYVPETLMSALSELEESYSKVVNDSEFQREFQLLLSCYVGRPTPLQFAKRFSEFLGYSIRVYLKREDLNHTGAHKINNALGQALLAKKMGKRRIIAETGAGQHGVATATACAFWVLNAWFTWAKRMLKGRLSMSSAWNCSAPKWKWLGAVVKR